MGGEIGISAFRQQLGFRLMWLASSSWLRLSADRIVYALPPSGAAAAVKHAAVVRVPLRVGASLAPTLERLREHDPDHHYYPPDTLHVTLRKLGEFHPEDPGVAARLTELRDAVASHPSFDLTVRGLNLSPTTVFAEIIPHGGTFHSLGSQLRGIAARSVHQSSSKRVLDAVTSNLAHANVVRFSGPVTAGLVKEVSRFRRATFGRWTVREIEFVRSDKLLSREGTYVIDQIPLATF